MLPASGGRWGNDWGAPRSNGRRHQGVDVFGAKGSPARAPVAGSVVRIGSGGLGGLSVTMTDAQGRTHYMAHLDRIDVRVGQQLAQGARIGTVGTTGNAASTPSHVHYEIRVGGSAVKPHGMLPPSGSP